jgi:hypothetical protein
MGVQTLATERNAQVEIFIQNLVTQFAESLVASQQLKSFKVIPQEHTESDIASDVWDFLLVAKQLGDRDLEIWCQTTCYKGNAKGKPEPNKTYEVRETLTEAISIREKFCNQDNTDRYTLHFTVGDARYTYKWFMDLKQHTFDKSIYIGQSNYDLFTDLITLLRGCSTETEKIAILNQQNPNYPKVTEFQTIALKELNDWWSIASTRRCKLADQQFQLVRKRISRIPTAQSAKEEHVGIDIKGRINAALLSSESRQLNRLEIKTLEKLVRKNPFLSLAFQVNADWEDFMEKLKVTENLANAEEYLAYLWNYPLPERMAIRRILLRCYTDETISYIADLDIEGVTEHSLYSADQKTDDVKQIVAYLKSKLHNNSIATSSEILSVIRSRGKRILNAARYFESNNGTELKPSFDYVQIALEHEGYQVMPPKKAGFHSIGYHSELTNETVRPYTNVKIVCDRNGTNLCILKAKYFSQQEFARRCKEEAYVGLTLKNRYDNGVFSPRTKLPLVMFCDMARDCKPPAYSINLLKALYWEVFFSITELITFLEKTKTSQDETRRQN